MEKRKNYLREDKGKYFYFLSFKFLKKGNFNLAK